MRTRLLLTLLGIIAVTLSYADRVSTRAGRTLTGAITYETPAEVGIKTDKGTLRVRRQDISEVVREETTVEEVDGDNAYGAGKYADALEFYKTALQRVPATGQGNTRLKGKVAAIEQAHSTAVTGALGAQIVEAKKLAASGQYDRAQAILESVLPSLSPKDEVTTALRRALAEIHYAKSGVARDRVDEINVRKELQAAIVAFDPFYKAHLAIGEMLMRSPATEQQGIDEINKGLQYAGNELTEAERLKYHYLIGKRYFDRDNFELAATHFAECLRVKNNSPQYTQARDLAVIAYVKMGEQNVMLDSQKRIANLQEALRLNPDDADAHFLLGRMYRDAGKLDQSIDELSITYKLNPGYQQVCYYIAQNYRDKQDFEKALEYLGLELKSNANNYDALVDRAEVHIKQLDFDKASNDLDQAVKVDSQNWRAYLLRAQLEFSKEQYPAAQENLMRVLQLKPDALEAQVLMGKVLKAAEQYDAAKKWFQNVIDYLEKVNASKTLSFKYKNIMAEAQTAMGDIDLRQKSPRQAETRFKLALDLVPDFAPAFNKIGDVKRDLGNESPNKKTRMELYREAETYYKKAISESPKEADFQLSLGILYHQQLKDTPNAIESYRNYLRLGGRDKANVEKWIDECGSPQTKAGAAGTTATADGSTSGTVAADGSTSGSAATGETSGTVGADSKTSATASGPAKDGTTTIAGAKGTTDSKTK